MVLQPVVKPVVLAFEADQYASRLPVPGDEDFLGFSQRRLAHLASRAPHAGAMRRIDATI